MTVFAIMSVFILGAMIGSFLNVCIYRLPNGKSVVFPPSSCPHCGKPIRWYDNIPVISYLVLRGKCRSCKGRIRFRYIIVEILTALLLTLGFMAFRGEGLAKVFAYSVMTCGLIVATFVDLEIQEIPDEISMGLLIVGLMLAAVFPHLLDGASRWHSFLNSFLGAVAGAASIYLMGFFGELVFKKEAMGGGDVKLMAMIGAFLGWRLILLVFFIAPVFGAAVGVILRIKDGREIIPYGPYLSLAAVIAVFWGERILGLFFQRMY